MIQFNILTDSQYGFRSDHSTSMALIDLYDKISESVDKREYCVGIFIDFKKGIRYCQY